MTRPLSTAETLRRVIESHALDLHVALPGVVRSYDHETQTADVEPGVQRVRPAEDEDTDADSPERLPVIPAVPVAWPRAGGHFVHWPMQAGDSVLLVFSESDLNAWRESGGVVDPGIGARHGLSGAIAIPGLYPRADVIASADASNGRIGRDGGHYVEFRADEIRIAGGEDLTLADPLEAHLKAIELALGTIATAAGAVNSYDHDVLSAAGSDYRSEIAKGA